MTDGALRQQRLDAIQALHTEAARLAKTKDDPLKDLIARAVRNLKEATVWLDLKDLTASARLQLADREIASASQKLDTVAGVRRRTTI